MGFTAEKRTVRERIAAEVSDGHLDAAATLGSAQLPRGDGGAVLTRHDETGLSLRDRAQLVARDGKDLGLELAGLLLRAKYAGDHRGVKRANFLFAIRMRFRARRQVRSSVRAERLAIAVASQSIAEWIADRCERCQGTGRYGVAMGGFLEKIAPCHGCLSPAGEPTGFVHVYGPRYRQLLWAGDHDGQVLSPPRVTCPDCRGTRINFERVRVMHNLGSVCMRCDGTGDAPPRSAERARALGLKLEIYHRTWARWFDWAGKHLRALDQTLVKNLRCEVGRGYSPDP